MKDISNPPRIIAAVFGGIVILLGLGIWVESENRSAQLARLDAGLRQSADTIGFHFSDAVEMAELSLTGLQTDVRSRLGTPEIADSVSNIMQYYTEQAPRLDNLLFIGVSGDLVASSRRLPTSSEGFTAEDFFSHHRDNASKEPLLGAPLISRFTSQKVLPISKRIDDAAGDFAGVIVAELSVARINDLLGRTAQEFDSLVLLVRDDGIVLSAVPALAGLIGSMFPAAGALPDLMSTPSNEILSAPWPMDGIWRRNALFRMEVPPIRVLVGATEASVLEDWKAEAYSRSTVAILLALVAVALAARWMRQAKLHRASVATLREREAEIRLLADASGDLIERLSVHGVRQYVSAASTRIFGLAPDALLGTCVTDQLEPQERVSAIAIFERLRRGEPMQRVTNRYCHPAGTTVWLETTLTALHALGEVKGIVAITRDVTLQKERHDELDSLANTDALTGLANRRSFDQHLRTSMLQARETNRGLTLLVIDVDRFKLYNDAYGHVAGDACLKSLAGAMAQAVRRTDFVARYGGEEFAVILDGYDQATAKLISEKIRQRISALRLPHDNNIPWGHATVSVGVACFDGATDADVDAPSLFSAADAALYEAKNTGRNRVVLACAPIEASRVGTIV